MANGLRTVAALADPVGEVLDGWRRPNGLLIERVRVPLGRRRDHLREPSQRHERRGRAVREVRATRRCCAGRGARCARTSRSSAVLRDALAKHGLPEDAVLLVEDVAHEAAIEVMQLARVGRRAHPARRPGADPEHPRQRDRARRSSTATATATCTSTRHADLDEALTIVVNAKTHRTSVCNAAESLVVHEAVADTFVRACADVLHERGVELVGDDASRARSPHIAARHRRRLRPRVPRHEDERRGRAVARRGDRARQPLRQRVTPKRSSPATSTRRGGSRARSTPPRWS